METTPSKLSPGVYLAGLLWFATLVGGTVLLAFGLLIHNPEHRLDDAFGVALLVSLFAAILSLPTLLILPFGLRWVFYTAALSKRWIRLLLVIGGLFGLAVSCGFRYLASIEVGTHKELAFFMAPYLPAALLAASYIYRPWLFRP